MAGEHLDLTSEPDDSGRRKDAPAASNAGPQPPPGKRFVGVNFMCCSVYSRVYRTRDGMAYAGYCPKCSKPVRLEIGEGGSNSRFYTAY